MYWPLSAPRVYAVNKTSQSLSQNSEAEQAQDDSSILGLRISRSGQIFVTITATTLTVWQIAPVVALSSVVRSPLSLTSYGANVAVLLKPDSSIAVVQTALGFLVTYHVNTDPNARVYQQFRQDDSRSRRQSLAGRIPVEEERLGQREVHIRFRMVIRIDAGISTVLALDEELVVATEKPAAVQCIRWEPTNGGSQTSTELLNRMAWMNKKSNIVNITFNRAMSLHIFIANDGRAYAVQKILRTHQEADSSSNGLFRGYGFHVPSTNDVLATKGAINARFSLLAIGCANGEVHVYTARDYVGNIPLSHKLTPPAVLSVTGTITFINYSPDGYCLFVGYEKGWATWSVYGKQGGNSFSSDPTISRENDDKWLLGIQSGHWISGGSEIILTSQNDHRIWALALARSAVTSCFCAANISRMLLQTDSSLMLYRGLDVLDLVSVSSDPSLWHHVQIPVGYLANQHPIRCAVISLDGRYVAIAGRRGLAHYSIHSGRWKTFDDVNAENSFVVRGGMCWHQHILIAAVEAGESFELRLYSRELGLNASSLTFVEQLSAPAVAISPTGDDSLLVYTQENILYHFVITASSTAVRLVQVGQIGLHGIVRAPARVRAVTWYIPDYQLQDGDPSQDVVHASVIFLVDAKLVLLQPSKNEDGALKYDMRIIANDVEYFVLTRDQDISFNVSDDTQNWSKGEEDDINGVKAVTGLTDSLWYFDGQQIQCWTDIQALFKTTPLEEQKYSSSPTPISTDFYPTSVILDKGIILGIEPDLVQRRDAHFALFRFTIRTQLFLPPILHHHLSTFDSSAALKLSYHYQQLPYFSHALEVLLHTVLDAEVESSPSQEEALLPSVLSFLSSFPEYLDILVQCTRKTEMRSWRTLFAYLPPPKELFDESLQKGLLKTAGGYLLVLDTFEESNSSSEQCIRLLRRAKEVGDWDLCKELARFLMALDKSGTRLRQAMEQINLKVNDSEISNDHIPSTEVTHFDAPRTRGVGVHKDPAISRNASPRRASEASRSPSSRGISPGEIKNAKDNFSS